MATAILSGMAVLSGVVDDAPADSPTRSPSHAPATVVRHLSDMETCLGACPGCVAWRAETGRR
ncbi:hypothetical protein [Streptomyces sp. TS71-3]|uniref:hypothetical protein n=1 Tax=Streptomyces sp. TS71-3 TaxID=2733862 RepID=UPI001BB36086|nr:hypothetical protein [Streptomyces sp. TS71-3]